MKRPYILLFLLLEIVLSRSTILNTHHELDIVEDTKFLTSNGTYFVFKVREEMIDLCYYIKCPDLSRDCPYYKSTYSIYSNFFNQLSFYYKLCARHECMEMPDSFFSMKNEVEKLTADYENGLYISYNTIHKSMCTLFGEENLKNIIDFILNNKEKIGNTFFIVDESEKNTNWLFIYLLKILLEKFPYKENQQTKNYVYTYEKDAMIPLSNNIKDFFVVNENFLTVKFLKKYDTHIRYVRINFIKDIFFKILCLFNMTYTNGSLLPSTVYISQRDLLLISFVFRSAFDDYGRINYKDAELLDIREKIKEEIKRMEEIKQGITTVAERCKFLYSFFKETQVFKNSNYPSMRYFKKFILTTPPLKYYITKMLFLGYDKYLFMELRNQLCKLGVELPVKKIRTKEQHRMNFYCRDGFELDWVYIEESELFKIVKDICKTIHKNIDLNYQIKEVQEVIDNIFCLVNADRNFFCFFRFEIMELYLDIVDNLIVYKTLQNMFITKYKELNRLVFNFFEK